MNFLSYDSVFMVWLRKAVDYFLLGLLWILASIPVITFGAATTAMFFTADKSIRRGNEKLFLTYWGCFRKEFKQATVIWLISLAIIAFSALNVFVLFTNAMPSFLRIGCVAVIALVVCWMQLWFWYLSKFEDTVPVLLGNTFRILMLKLPLVIGLCVFAVVAVGGAVGLLFYAPPFALLIPGGYALLAGIIFRYIFRDFMPKDTETNT